jgi:tetratricopeptide (TPR) repeat protein
VSFRRRRPSDQQTVMGTQVEGSVYQVQNIEGDVYIGTGAVPRSAYIEQVRLIAPMHLEGRQPELAELASFCTSSEGAPYLWLRGSAWAGKSALLSWFTLNPPPNVQIVPFFVTSRFRHNADRGAFITVVLEQLAELLHEPLPVLLSEANQEGHLRRALIEAADWCSRKSKQLVLIVDGLDEDVGVTVGPDSYSIASLLPMNPPPALRVIVSARLHPPIPDDVPSEHPLRDPRIVKPLSASEAAQVVRVDMQRELARLLHGSSVEQRLLGLLTAAGGGLSSSDLAELTGSSPAEITEILRSVSGRTFDTRLAYWQPGSASHIFILGHEELQTTAWEHIGRRRLMDYADQLHAWAKGYRRRGWPEGTPEYLLTGYYSLTRETRPSLDLVALAVDIGRHNRMLALSGNDIAALGEVTDTERIVLSEQSLDLAALVKLGVHRDDLVERNRRGPVELIRLWGQVGNTRRAASIAHGGPDPRLRAGVLISVAMEAAQQRDEEVAVSLLERAEADVRQAPDADRRAWGLAAMAWTFAVLGEESRARELCRTAEQEATAVPDIEKRVGATCAVLRGLTQLGDVEQAQALAAELTAALKRPPPKEEPSLSDWFWQELSRSRPPSRDEALTEFVSHGSAAHSLWSTVEWANEVSGLVGDPYLHAVSRSLTVAIAGRTLGEAAARQVAREAYAAIDRISDSGQRLGVLGVLAGTSATAGDAELTRSLLQEILGLEESLQDVSVQLKVLISSIDASSKAGETELTELLIQQARAHLPGLSPAGRANGLIELAETFATLQRAPDAQELAAQAISLVDELDRPRLEARLLIKLAEVLALSGAREDAIILALRAETVARSVTDPVRRAREAALLVIALSEVGDQERAREAAELCDEMIGAISDPLLHGKAQAALVHGLALMGERARAGKLAKEIAPLIQLLSPFDIFSKSEIIEAAALALAYSGEANRAIGFVREVGAGWWHQQQWSALVGTIAQAVGPGQTEVLIDIVAEPNMQIAGLALIADSYAGRGEMGKALVKIDQGYRLVSDVEDDTDRIKGLLALAEVAARIGHGERSLLLIEEAETRIREVGGLQDEEAKIALVAAVASSGNVDRAEQLAYALENAVDRATALATIAKYASQESATELIGQALQLGSWTHVIDLLPKLAPGAVVELGRIYLASMTSRRVEHPALLGGINPLDFERMFDRLDPAIERWPY